MSTLKNFPTLYLQSSPPERMRSFTEFQSIFITNPSWAFHWSRTEKKTYKTITEFNQDRKYEHELDNSSKSIWLDFDPSHVSLSSNFCLGLTSAARFRGKVELSIIQQTGMQLVLGDVGNAPNRLGAEPMHLKMTISFSFWFFCEAEVQMTSWWGNVV